MKSKPSILSIITSVMLLALCVILSFYVLDNQKPQSVYLDNVAVFSKFNLSKDLNSKHQKELNAQKSIVDVIIAELNEGDAAQPNEELQRRYVYESNKLNEMSEFFTNNVSQQVWLRVNDYVKEFGEKNNYAIILGTQGNGNIMFAQKEYDITEEFIAYANNKYEGN